MYPNKQAIYDTAVAGLAKQGFRRSMAPLDSDMSGQCMYRGQDDCKCFAGQLVPDALYDPRAEGGNVRRDCTYGYAPSERAIAMLEASGVRLEDWEFLREGQLAHDNAKKQGGDGTTAGWHWEEIDDPESMKSRLRELGRKYGLVIPACLAEAA